MASARYKLIFNFSLLYNGIIMIASLDLTEVARRTLVGA